MKGGSNVPKILKFGYIPYAKVMKVKVFFGRDLTPKCPRHQNLVFAKRKTNAL